MCHKAGSIEKDITFFAIESSDEKKHYLSMIFICLCIPILLL